MTISASKLLYFSLIILTQITENINYVDIDIYTETDWTFPLAMAQNEYRERELRKFDPFRKLSLVWRTW